MLHDRARANKGTIIKVPSLMHFWALLLLLLLLADSKCGAQRNSNPGLSPGVGVSSRALHTKIVEKSEIEK
jgi:hypothetical protein